MTFTFEGRPVGAESGQSVAAALWASGVRSWRRTRIKDQPRGLFCGIGVCFDCLVVINGQGGQRACLVEARDGDIVEPHPVIKREKWSSGQPLSTLDQEGQGP